MAMNEEVTKLVEIVRRLRAPGGCPWDRAQTHDSIKKNLVEECGEFLDAVEEHDLAEMREELGDLLLQVVLHCQIADEAGHFNLEEVAREEADKLIRRHEHVFGARHAGDAAEALKIWENSKRHEGGAQARRHSVMDGVPRAMPGLARCQKALAKAAKNGFEWADVNGAAGKVEEEWNEVKEAIRSGDHAQIAEELGDLLCAAVKLCAMEHLEAEELMHRATLKFIRRFQAMEHMAKGNLKELTAEQWRCLWEAAKDSGCGTDTTAT